MSVAEAYYPYVGAKGMVRQRSQMDRFHQAAKRKKAALSSRGTQLPNNFGQGTVRLGHPKK
jgi:hypothetical protein